MKVLLTIYLLRISLKGMLWVLRVTALERLLLGIYTMDDAWSKRSRCLVSTGDNRGARYLLVIRVRSWRFAAFKAFVCYARADNNHPADDHHAKTYC